MASVRVEVRGAREAASRFSLAARSLPLILRAEMRGRLSASLVRVYQAVAPVRTGRLRSRVQGTLRDQTLEVESPVTSDEGYHYTGVTRFGHRGRIYPKRAKALRFQIAGRTVFAASTAGYHPDHDWAKDGVGAARQAVGASGRYVGRRVAEIA